jgi:hypothetical protein
MATGIVETPKPAEYTQVSTAAIRALFIEPLFGRPGENLSGGSLADDLTLPHIPENLVRRGHTCTVVAGAPKAAHHEGAPPPAGH